MMVKRLKLLFKVMAAVCVGLVIGYLGYNDFVRLNKVVPDYEELISPENGSSHFLVSKQKKIIERSRSSAVRVLSLSGETGGIASSSGTYLTMYNHYYIITTQHGVVGECDTTKIIADDISYDCLRFIEINEEIDYALIEIEKIIDREPIKIPEMAARTGKEWRSALTILAKTFYTGFPNGIGPLTVDGKIMGHSREGYVYMNSYAWSGSSGSGVFSHNGDYIGYVLAIDVGYEFGGPNILENVVLVVPAYKINWSAAIDFLDISVEQQDTSNYSNIDTNSEN